MLAESLDLAVLVALMGLGIYSRQYLSEKAKNLASKEDVAKITDRVETIKIDYSRQLEAFKSYLHHQWGSHSEYARDRKEALLRFFESCTTLLADKLIVNPGDLPLDNGQSLFHHQQEIGELFTRIYLDYLRLSLYFPGESDLIKQAAILTKYSFEARREFDNHFSKVKHTLAVEGEAITSGVQSVYLAAVEKSNEAGHIYSVAMRPKIEDMNRHFKDYLTALNAYLKQSGARPAPFPNGVD